MVSEKTKQQAADSLTDKGISFSVEYNGRKYSFMINKLVLKTLIRISGEVQKLVKYNYKTSNVEVILSVPENAARLTRCIAIAVINSKPEKRKHALSFLFPRNNYPENLNEDELTRLFELTLNSDQLKTLSTAVVTQMDTGSFFAATISIGGIDLLRQTDGMVTDPLTQSGEE